MFWSMFSSVLLRSGVFFTQKKRPSRKGWLDFSSLNLTKGVTGADSKDNVGGARVGDSKGESMTTAAEAGAEDTGCDGY